MALTEKQLREDIKSKNKDTFASLERQLRTPLGVIPFVGAGISASVKLKGIPPRFPQWSELLREFARGRAFEAKVKKLLVAGDYEAAASAVNPGQRDWLTPRIRDAFDREIEKAQVLRGPVSYLPFLANGPVITTNYDYVLERAFEAADRRFKTVISGPLVDTTVAAIHGNERALIKIHGDCRDSMFRVLTVDEYERAYGSMRKARGAARADIGSLAWLLFTNRPLLFLGCSLAQDRTVSVLRSICQQLKGLVHYAVVAAEHSRKAWEKRQQHFDELGVRVLWFMPGKFDEIERLLSELLEATSVCQLQPRATVHQPRRSPTPPIKMADIARSVSGNERTAEATRYRVDIDRIGQAIRDERLAFFLGAYANLTPSLLGDSFYRQLAEKFDCPALSGDRTAVAGFIIRRYGSGELWNEVRAAIQRQCTEPSMVHRFIAALPAFLRKDTKSGQLCILTTNYDTLMEQALTEAGEPFHMLYYVNDGLDGTGCFLERSPNGDIWEVQKAENLRHPRSPAHLLVKLNGGISYHGDLGEQVSIERAQFERLAARIPSILPRFLQTELQSRSLLFLGHGLAEPDVQSLIEYAAGNDRKLRSWAIQKRPAGRKTRRAWQEDIEHWRGLSLKVLEADLERFIAALCLQVTGSQRAPISGTASPGKPRSETDRRTVFISYPKDIAPSLMKRIVSGIIARGLQVWLWDAIPYGFSDDEAGKIMSLVHGDSYVDGALKAARNADAILFLISPWTLQSKFQADELSVAFRNRHFVPCIVDENIGFDQLPAKLKGLFVAKVTGESLSASDGRARLRKLIDDVVEVAAERREPTNTRRKAKR
jgi:hypothetical protein